MPRSEGYSRVQLSVLDRLVDDRPAEREEPLLGRAQVLRAFKAAVRRDLEWLLNTRAPVDVAPDALDEVKASVYHYGLTDFTAVSLSSPLVRKTMLREIEDLVRTFEPRLSNVTVTGADELGLSRQLSFVINGLLRLEAAPEPVRFDTKLEAHSGEYRVTEN